MKKRVGESIYRPHVHNRAAWRVNTLGGTFQIPGASDNSTGRSTQPPLLPSRLTGRLLRMHCWSLTAVFVLTPFSTLFSQRHPQVHRTSDYRGWQSRCEMHQASRWRSWRDGHTGVWRGRWIRLYLGFLMWQLHKWFSCIKGVLG